MAKKKIKNKLKHQTIISRSSTLRGAFAAAIAPYDIYDDSTYIHAMSFLNQNPEQLKCTYCGKDANTWDHLVNLVKNYEFQGYGHQLGNLVPCCSDCNSKKGSKSFQDYINEFSPFTQNEKQLLIKNLEEYQSDFAIKVDVELLQKHRKFKRYVRIRERIIKLMEKADSIAFEIRENYKLEK